MAYLKISLSWPWAYRVRRFNKDLVGLITPLDCRQLTMMVWAREMGRWVNREHSHLTFVFNEKKLCINSPLFAFERTQTIIQERYMLIPFPQGPLSSTVG